MKLRQLKIVVAVASLVAGVTAATVEAQSPVPLTLQAAREAARAASQEVAAARAASVAAAARVTQSRAYPNPILSLAREQASRGSGRTGQIVTALEQRVETPGVRSARRAAAERRHDAAEARLVDLSAAVDLDVARAFAYALAADRRAALADSIAIAFDAAVVVSDRRFRDGDISGLAARRIRLEAARYAALRAAAVLARREARLVLGGLLAPALTGTQPYEGPLEDAAGRRSLTIPAESISAAARHRPDIVVASREAEAAAEDARLAVAERFTAPSLQLGFKNEDAVTGGSLRGLVAGLVLPLPLWDRRSGTVAAADADALRRRAELKGLERRAVTEAGVALAALRAVEEQLAILSDDRLADAGAALRAAQAAYAEGEFTVLEWLDTVRAYHETQLQVAALRADGLIRMAELERATGISLIEESR